MASQPSSGAADQFRGAVTSSWLQLRELQSQEPLDNPDGCGRRRERLGWPIHIADQLAGDFGDGVWYVDLAPITDPDLVPTTAARALGCPTNRAAQPLTR